MVEKAKSETLKTLEIPLSGKLRLDIDPLMLGTGDFQSIVNMRYTSNHPRGVLGMSKVNAAATSYTRVDNLFHFRKGQPSESHILAQTSSGGNSRIVKSDNTTSIPSQDTFSTFQALADDDLVRFSDSPDGCVAMCDGTTNYIWGGDEYRCASFFNYKAAGTLYYEYTDKIQNTLTDANNVATMAGTILYIGSTMPLQGIKFYIGTANTNAVTAVVEYWNAAAWVAVTNLVDNTSSGGKSLAVTGKMTFNSTASVAKLKAIKNNILYYYKLTFTGVSTATTIYHCTVDAPNQSLKDIWDGTARLCLMALKYTATYSDYTTNVYTSDYVSTDTTTYAQLGALVHDTQFLYLGFAERMMGVTVTLPDAATINANASTLTVYYWNGAAWATVGTVDDSTSTGGASLAHMGTITWDAPAENLEFKTTQATEDLYYYYRFVWSGDLSADVRIDLISGIPAQKTINARSVPLMWRKRLWLFDEKNNRRNTGICSSAGTMCVFNGSDSTTLSFGNDEAAVAASTLFTRYGGTLYDNLVVYKSKSMYLVDGATPSEWTGMTYTISEEVGCIAPLTLQKCDVSYEVAPGLTKHVLIWQSSRGIEFFDGNAVTPISEDIRCFFDVDNSNYINTSIVDEFSAYYDPIHYEYHWLFATGSSTSLNKEFAYDLRKKKWFEVNRGTGKALRCGVLVSDSIGNRYALGGTTDGYIERLENGTTFDGNDIAYSIRLGDFPLTSSMSYVTEIRHVKLTCVAKNTTASNIIMNHYGDTRTTPESISAISEANSSGRLVQAKRSVSWNAVTHSIEASISTDNENVGFEPLVVSAMYRILREDI